MDRPTLRLEISCVFGIFPLADFNVILQATSIAIIAKEPKFGIFTFILCKNKHENSDESPVMNSI